MSFDDSFILSLSDNRLAIASLTSDRLWCVPTSNAPPIANPTGSVPTGPKAIPATTAGAAGAPSELTR